jgi:hypothetical protein
MPSFGIPGENGMSDFFKEMDTQTDRGVAVLGGSYLEWRLRQGIQTRFDIWDSNVTRVFGKDEGSTPRLGFRKQSEIAYGLGLIGPISLSDLILVAEIRNRFAHRPSVRSFDHKDVSAQVDKLKTPGVREEKINQMCRDIPNVGPVQKIIGRRNLYLHTVLVIAFAIWEAGIHYSQTTSKLKTSYPHSYW